jgi:hypothetical protein
VLDGEVAVFDDRLVSRFDLLANPDPQVSTTPPVYVPSMSSMRGGGISGGAVWTHAGRFSKASWRTSGRCSLCAGWPATAGGRGMRSWPVQGVRGKGSGSRVRAACKADTSYFLPPFRDVPRLRAWHPAATPASQHFLPRATLDAAGRCDELRPEVPKGAR